MDVGRSFALGAVRGGGGTITSVIPATHQAKAAYRLLDHPAVTHQAVIEPHGQWVRSHLDEPGITLLIEDTTALSYPNREKSAGLGPIGESSTRGYWLHSTLAVRWKEAADADQPDQCWPIGLVDQQAWARPARRPDRRKSKGKGKESNHARMLRENRESIRWAAALVDLPQRRNPEALWVYVADRESDIYEVFGRCSAASVSLVIRAAHSRAIVDDEPLMKAVSQAPVLGELQLHLPNQNRTARLEVRAAPLELKGPPRPGGRPANVTMNVVRMQEIDAPQGTEPLQWTLLTDLPIATLADCSRAIRIYRTRWMIEELHKAMKTGLGVELSQLSDFRRLSTLGGIISVVSVHLLQMKWKARTTPDTPMSAEEQNEPITRILRKTHPPKGQPTYRWMWITLARLGGYQARKSDGPPGWLTLWRGWQTLQILLRGYEMSTA